MTTNINNLRDPPDQWDFILLSKHIEIRPWERELGIWAALRPMALRQEEK